MVAVSKLRRNQLFCRFSRLNEVTEAAALLHDDEPLEAE